ncbi:MAG: O-antigen ligase family protein [Armatimonadota bacterium]
MRIARLCLLLLLLLIPLLGGQPGVVPLAVFGVLAAFGWLGWATEREAALPAGFPLRWPFLVLLGFTILTTFTSVYKPASVLAIWQLSVLAGAALLIAAVPLDRRQLLIGVGAFCAGVLASIVYGWYFWAKWNLAPHEFSWRIGSTWINPNYYAAFLVVILPALVILARQGKTAFWRWGVGALAGLTLMTLMMTQSRGGVLALLLCLLFFLPAWAWAEGRLSACTLGLGAAGFAVLIGLLLLSPVGQRVLDPEIRVKQLHSQMFRYHTWRGTLDMIRDYPVLGSGPNTFASAFGKYQLAGFTSNPHQMYLLAAAETGWAGMLALLFFFGGIAWVGVLAIKRAGEDRLPRVGGVALLASLLGLLLHGLVDADWSFPGIQLTLVLQAVLLWRLLDPLFAPASRLRILLPVLSLGVAAMLVLGAYAASFAEKGRDPGSQATRGERAEFYRMALRLAPTNAEFLRRASYSVPPETGREYLAAAMRLERTNAANWQLRGLLNLQQRDYAQALADFRAAAEKEPGNFVTLLGIAQASFKLEDYAACRRALEQILATRGTLRDTYRPIDVPVPAYAQARYALAVLDLRTGRNARGELEQTLAEVRKYQQEYKDEATALEQHFGSKEKQLIEKIEALAGQQLAPTVGPGPRPNALPDPFPQP